MCSCRWAHSRWAVTRKPKYSPRKPVCLHLSRAAYIWERWASGTTGMLKTYLMYFQVVIPQQKCFFSSSPTFSRLPAHFLFCFHKYALSHAHTASHMQVKDPCGFAYVMLDSHQLIFTRKHKQIAASVSAACPESKNLVLAPSVCSNNWGTCFYEAKKTLLDSNVGNCWEENVPNSFPPSSWLVINQLLLFLLFFSFILRTERSITETFLSR